jgi:protein-disulfide isomerase
MRRTRGVLAAALALALHTGAASAQVPPADNVRREIEELREMLREMQLDIREIKDSMPRRSLRDPVGASVDLSRLPSRGDPAAPLVLVEYSDYQCPFCARHARETAPLIDREYVQAGRVRHVFVDLPLERAHPLALKAAEAAACAGEQKRFWEMHDRLFASQDRLEPWVAHAEALSLGGPAFEECLASGRHAAAIRRGVAEAARLSIATTPYFLIGRSERGGTSVRVVTTLPGARPFAAFKEVLDGLLAEAAPRAGPPATP